MPNAVVTLKKGAGRTLKQGGPWIYDNEVESIMGSFTDGDIVLVHDFDGYPLGREFEADRPYDDKRPGYRGGRVFSPHAGEECVGVQEEGHG